MMESETKDNTSKSKDLKKIIADMTRDLLNTFPELNDTLDDGLRAILNNEDNDDVEINKIFEYCRNIFPERFFDILYQNNKIFSVETEDNVNVEFLPGINFKDLWKENISDKTKETIWKYLQLILFTTVSNISDGDSFGDTAKLFEAINEDEFKAKLTDTINQMQSVFENNKNGETGENSENSENGENGENSEGSMPGFNVNDLPDPNTIHEHVNSMMEGKLGSLAREIAEETANDLNMDMENSTSINDVFQKLFKNPTKLMGLVKNIGSKLDAKIKSGDIKESELLAEATDIVQKMKDMPGMGNLQSMLGKMGMGGMGGMGGGGKMNTSAMQAHLNRNMKMAKQRERMKAKADEKQNVNSKINPEEFKIQEQMASKAAADLLKSEGFTEDGIENLVFSTGEKYEKSVRSEQDNTQKKKKNKKKKKKESK